MTEFVNSSTFFCVCLTLIAFSAAAALQRKWKLAIVNPIVISSAVIIAVLKVLNISNEVYQEGCRILSFLLTPATICLSISFYEQFQNLKKHLLAVTAGVAAGTVASIGAIWALSVAFGLDRALTASMLPKSVTTAIGVALSSELGGIAAITTAAIVITGIFGNIIGPALCKLFRLDDPVAQGAAFGTSAHVIGTTRALEMNALAGAVSSLSLTLAGIVTCVIMSFLAQFV